MLSRSVRLSRNQFPAVATSRSVVHGQMVSLRYIKTDDLNSSCTFVVSGKTAPRAVDRNLLKRRGRAILKSLLPSVSPGYRCAFFFKKQAVGQSFAHLEAEIVVLLRNAGILT